MKLSPKSPCTLLVFVVWSTLTAAACNSNSTIATGPSPVKCQLSTSLTTPITDPGGGLGAFAITTTPECTWTAVAQAPWITGISPASGQGSGQVEFRLAANPQATAREGDILVNNERMHVTQDAAPCRIDVTPRSHDVGAAGGTVASNVSTLSGCSWTVRSDASWIAASLSNGTGSGSFTLQIAANSGDQRTGLVEIGDQRLAVVQASVSGCSFGIAPTGQSIAVTGGAGGPVTVSTSAGCSWQAVSNVPWIVISGADNGSGAGTVRFNVAANTGSGRTGTLTIARETFTVTQAGVANCVFVINPASQSVGAAGGSAPTVSVSTTAGCTWTTTSNVPWITVVSGATGSGNGAVSYQVAANTGNARTGSLTIAGHAFSVSQGGAAPCSYSISPASDPIAVDGGTNRTVTLSTIAGCTWSIDTEAPWITITSPRSGSGSTVVTYSVAPNSGLARTGTILIANQVFTVNQQGSAGQTVCGYAVAPTSHSLGANGGTATLTVTAGNDCAWTAASHSSWITISSGAAGSGTGSVSFTVAPNTGAERTGTLTVAGQTITITQSAAAQPACTYNIAPTAQTVAATGLTGSSVTVTAGSGCAWTATSNASWISITSGAAGSGNGSITFNVAENTGGARSGAISVAGQTFTVNQAAAPPPPCTYNIAPTAETVAAAGATGSSVVVVVTAGAGCAWTATSNASWISITAGTTGSGNGSVTFNVAENTGAARTGTISVAGQTFTVNQAAAPPPPCMYGIAPTAQSVAATGATGSTVAVTAGAGCAWTATSNASWITITAGATGSGNGSVTFNVAENTGAARAGTISVAGQTFSVNQAAAPPPPCTYGIAPTGQTVPATGATGSTVAVTAGNGCGWTATSNASWIAITAGATGSGNGSVTFNVAANTGAARTGTMTVAGQTFTVNQAAAPAPCTYGIAPTSQAVDASGATGSSVAVTAGAGCGWTAASNASWITITSGATGTGNGSVTFNVAANTGPARMGTLTIAGQTFTVSQAAVACAFSVQPTSVSIGGAGGTGGPVAVTTTSGCAWTATSNAAWITITSGQSGTGNGSVTFAATPNTGSARTGTMTVAGQTVTVSQAVLICTYSIAPTSQTISGAGGDGGPISVTAPGGCSWTAVSNVSWATITSSASGSGNGTVTFTVSANPNGPRNGTLTIAGQTFQITQPRRP